MMVREMRGPKAEPEVNVGGTAGVLNSCPIIGQEFFYYSLYYGEKTIGG